MSYSLSITTSPSPRSFVTIYDWRTGVEVFDYKDRCWLKFLAQLMNVFILKISLLDSSIVPCLYVVLGVTSITKENHHA
jgi:hypothetical protein